MPTLGVADVIASCLRAQLGAGTRRSFSNGEQDEISMECLAQLVVVCLAAGGWAIVRRADLMAQPVMVLPQRGNGPKIRRVRRRPDQ